MQASKRYKLTFGILSVGYILLGILLFAMPKNAQAIICTVLGITAVVCGIIRVAYFFLKGDPTRAFQNDLAIGVVLLVGGIYVIANADVVWRLLPVILGFSIVFDSIIKLQYAFSLRQAQFSQWWGALVAALVTLVLGAVLLLGLLKDSAQDYFLATSLLVDGVANLGVLGLLTLQLRKNAKAAKRPRRKRKAREEDTPAEDAMPLPDYSFDEDE